MNIIGGDTALQELLDELEGGPRMVWNKEKLDFEIQVPKYNLDTPMTGSELAEILKVVLKRIRNY
jgi:hypothetical protein